MAIQLGALRDALVEAGASPATAGRASEELASYNAEFTSIRDDMRSGFAKVDGGFAKVEGGFAKVDQELTRLRGEINLLRWMIGTNSALCVAILLRLFIH